MNQKVSDFLIFDHLKIAEKSFFKSIGSSGMPERWKFDVPGLSCFEKKLHCTVWFSVKFFEE